MVSTSSKFSVLRFALEKNGFLVDKYADDSPGTSFFSEREAWLIFPETLFIKASTSRRMALAAGISFSAGSVRETRIWVLYTSDAADERSSVDLGGRRVI